MVHGICEQSGGTFILKSKKNEGTTAEIWIPVASEGLSADDSRAVLSTYQAQARKTILAVDDDPLVLTNTIAMLEELGHEAIPAASGKQALEILRSRSIDAVVTDQVMPSMTGLQLALEIRRQWPRLPVVLATGFADFAPGESLHTARLTKPFTEADLARELSLI
jgi:CheY-like chemotaxis protein